MSRADSRQGFSLIEMIVVVTILSLLATLIGAGVGRALDRARAVQSASNLRQLAQANLSYAVTHGRYAPVANQQNDLRWSGGRASDGTFDPGRGYLADYLGPTRSITACPMFTRMLKQDSFEQGTGGYGYNDTYIGGRPGGAYRQNGDRVSATPAMIIRPSKTVMFTTSAYANGDTLQEYPFSHPPFWDFGDGPNEWGIRPSPSTHFRFDGHALIAWCDGRVSREEIDVRDAGWNPHGGDANAHQLGWFGPDEFNGYWNSSAGNGL